LNFKLLTAGGNVWLTPSSMEVVVEPNQENTFVGQYYVANPTLGEAPRVLDFDPEIKFGYGNNASYAFAGQLLS